MVYLQGMSHQFQINVISAFYNKFWNQFGKLFKRSWFFAFDIWKKRRRYVFNLLFFVVINFYYFFDYHDTWLLLLEYFLWFVQVSAVLERLFKCYFTVPLSLTRKFRKKTIHTYQTVFPWKIMGSFFLNYLFLQFNSRISPRFYFCEKSLSEEICGILLAKIYIFLYGNTKSLVSYIDISVSGSSAFYFLNV